MECNRVKNKILDKKLVFDVRTDKLKQDLGPNSGTPASDMDDNLRVILYTQICENLWS